VSAIGGGPIRTKALMDRIEDDVRSTLRRDLIEHGGPADYGDPELFERVRSLLSRGAAGRNLEGLLLPELLDGSVEWQLIEPLRFSSHRRRLGPLILFVKQRLLLPLSRWLLDYTSENFRRQQYLNRIVLACLEELALENARLRREIDIATGRIHGR
jgi:hypothetical protein